MVREHSDRAEAEGVSHRGAFRRENVGISSKKNDENSFHRKSKVSRATRIVPGLVGPKARPKGVVDGEQVNIPALPYFSDGGTHPSTDRVSWNEASGTKGRPIGKSVGHKPRGERKPGESRARVGTGVSRKSSRAKDTGTVPETDTGGWAYVCSGVRENPCLGTRQYSGRNFGIRPPRRKTGRSERRFPTVYQKHSFLQNRKVKYRK